METVLFSAFRRDLDLRSAMLAVCVLFLLTGMVGAFAVAATALPTAGIATDHCYSDAGDDLAGTAAIPHCCVIGCPMVGAALPGPANSVPLSTVVLEKAADLGPQPPIIPVPLIVALDTARGPRFHSRSEPVAHSPNEWAGNVRE
jgi:hypothetical protein